MKGVRQMLKMYCLCTRIDMVFVAMFVFICDVSMEAVYMNVVYAGDVMVSVVDSAVSVSMMSVGIIQVPESDLSVCDYAFVVSGG